MSNYGTPPPPPAPGYGPPMGAPGEPPPNYLVWAILSTIFCCLPLGIASIVFSTQVGSKWAMGDVAGALDASTKAKNFALWGTIAGVVVMVVYLGVTVMAVLTGGAAVYQSSY